MPEITIELPQKTIDELEKRARKNRRTLEQEVTWNLQRVADLARLENPQDT